MPLEFSQNEIPSTFSVLLYGEPGAGKSTAAVTAPGPILWLNLEGPGALGYPRKVARERGTEILEVRPGKNEVRKTLNEMAAYVRDGSVKTVVVDTLGKCRDRIITEVGGENPSIKQYGEAAKIIEKFVVHMRDADVNFVVICHENISEDGEQRIVQPLIGGTLTQKVPGDMDVVAYCGVRHENGTAEHVGQFVAANGKRAKDRSGGLGTHRLLDLSEWLSVYVSALSDDDIESFASADDLALIERLTKSNKIDLDVIKSAHGIEGDLTQEAATTILKELEGLDA